MSTSSEVSSTCPIPSRNILEKTWSHLPTATVRLLEERCFQQLPVGLGSSMIESFSWNVEIRRLHAPHPAASPTFQGSPYLQCNPRVSQRSRATTARISLLMIASL